MTSKNANGPSGRGGGEKGKMVDNKQRKLMTERRVTKGGKRNCPDFGDVPCTSGEGEEEKKSVYNKGESTTVGLRVHVVKGGQKEAWIG
ncbi:hypothetical protein G5I_02617 [Acromyrmex echinatior]|uniref:Uncharacterized protein n=1 Tax=Acromyrmex echinatior TaxID=103372 RepID=F4WAS5_ACREC|nr:hypothetical protein G5I_02617 [Acromyrmex echinatior]